MTGAEVDRTHVERRRFRTWEPDAEAPPDRAWRVIAKYGVMRLLGTWYMKLLLVLALIQAITFLGSFSYDLAAVPNGPTRGDFAAAASFAFVPAVAFLLLAASPLFSEDLRFNAPLFYFSKPVQARDYVAGKMAVVGLGLAAVTVLPYLLFLVLAFFGAVTATPVDFDGRPLAPGQMDEWEATHLSGIGDWLYATAFTLAGIIVYLAFVTSLFVLMSAYTQRAWHAAIGVVVLYGSWSILGLTVSEVGRTAVARAFGPVGWLELLVFAPMDARFGYWQLGGRLPEGLRNLEAAIPLAYALVIAATAGAWFLTYRRIKQTEGLA